MKLFLILTSIGFLLSIYLEIRLNTQYHNYVNLSYLNNCYEYDIPVDFDRYNHELLYVNKCKIVELEDFMT